MNKLLLLILILLFTNNCSFNKNQRIWKNKNIKIEDEKNIKELFLKKIINTVEFNEKLKLNLIKIGISNQAIKNNNNFGSFKYKGLFKETISYKFSKLQDVDKLNHKPIFLDDGIIFFNKKGDLIRYAKDKKIIWQKNYYSKSEKKQKPILYFSNNKKFLIVADNLAKYYMLNIETGELQWIKNNSAPFNSQIKIYKDKFFVIDFNNVLRAYSMRDGNEIWSIVTENTLIRSQKKLSMVILDEKIFFNNSLGDISSVDINSGELIWQSPTQSSLIYDGSFFLKTSDIIADKKTLYFSNNNNQFFALDINTGTVNWEQKINSNLRSTLIDDYIFTVSQEGYLIIIDNHYDQISA